LLKSDYPYCSVVLSQKKERGFKCESCVKSFGEYKPFLKHCYSPEHHINPKLIPYTYENEYRTLCWDYMQVTDPKKRIEWVESH